MSSAVYEREGSLTVAVQPPDEKEKNPMFNRIVLVVLVVAALVVAVPHSALASSARSDLAQQYTGGTNVYINGYELTYTELEQAQSNVGYLAPGYYWIDSGYLWRLDRQGYWRPVIYLGQPSSASGDTQQSSGQQSAGGDYDVCNNTALLQLGYIPGGC
jgi:hypothetical protein